MAEDKRSPFGTPLRVLVVEDNNVDVRVLESMLTDTPQFVSYFKIANNLTSSHKLLKEHIFDIAVLDLNLPDSSGIETLKNVRKNHPDLAIVVNTGAYEDDLGLHTLSQGAQDFLVKGKYSGYVLNKVLQYAYERKRLDLEIRKAYRNLKETQSQLVDSEKQKVVGCLASGIAHEVKNPLATILYGITFLEKTLKSKDTKVSEVLTSIKEAVARANTIITDLLDFSSLELLKKQMEDLNVIVEKSLELTRYQMEQGRVNVEKSLSQKIPRIPVDRNRIEQVLLNLILNSIAAMPDGGKLKLSTFVVDLNPRTREKFVVLRNEEFNDGDRIIVLSVEDTGNGIPKNKIEHIFDPFVTTRRGQGGVGLGLTVSRNIMENHGGRIYLENSSSGGARATLVFRVEKEVHQ